MRGNAWGVDAPGLSDQQPVFWKSEKPKTTFETWIVLTVVILAGGSFALATTQLILERDPIGYLKIILVALSATAVAYGVNRLAVEKGARQAATGFWLSGVVSIFSILFVGIGLFISTYAGLTRKGVEELRLHEHGAALERVIAARNRVAVEGNRFGAVLRGIVAELDQHRSCELTRGCISGRSAGRGPVTRFLEEKIARARSIVGEKQSGEGTRQGVVAQLNGLMIRYRRTLANIKRDIWARRIDLETIHALIDQQLALLDEAQPVVLMQAYAKELLAGINIPGRPEATARLNEIFKSHGETLQAILAEHGAGDQSRPRIPKPTSVGQTLDYIGQFIPIAMVVAVTELVLPLTVWIYVFIADFWARYRAAKVPIDRQTFLHRDEEVDEDGDDDDPTPQPSASTNGSPQGTELTVPQLSAEPIDGPHGWSGRSRYNRAKLDHGDQ